MWVIVVFSNENSVECIPECWLTDNNDKCYWPSYKGSRLKSAIALCEKPQGNWEKFRIRRINGDKTYDQLIKARSVCDRAQYTSDISDIDEVKRKPKKKILSSSSSEEDDEYSTQNNISIPSPPRIFNKPREYSEQFGKNHNFEDNVQEAEGIPESFKESDFASPKVSSQVPKLLKTPRTGYNNIDSPLQKEVKSMVSTAIDSKSFQEFQQLIIRKLNVINLKLDQMATDIVHLHSVLQENHQTVDPENDIHLNLPLNSIEQLENFEVQLQAKEKYAEMFAYMVKVGGNSEYDNVKRIFGRVMTNELANQYNWLGLKKKKPFNSLLLTKIAKEAILKNQVIKNATEKSIEFAIKNWLRHAKDRVKGTVNHKETQDADEI